MTNQQKVFGIGFHKTGTTTLEYALIELGYKVCGFKGDLVTPLSEGKLEAIEPFLEEYDAFQDDPWQVLYKELDERCPGSKFILTFREENSWMESMSHYFNTQDHPVREFIYGKGFGYPKGNETVYRKRYSSHIHDVRNYFKDRPNDFLEVSWAEGDGWDKLCSFLGKEKPTTSFPHKNKTYYPWHVRLRRKVRKLIS